MTDRMDRALAHAIKQIHRAGTVEDALDVLVRSAAQTLPTFDHVSVSTTAKGGNVLTRAATSDLAHELDDLQYATHQGPCLNSLRGEETVTAPHITLDRRWPHYMPQAVKRGLRSQLSVRLHLKDKCTAGALNLYSTTADDFTQDAVVTATFLASHASLTLGGARAASTLSGAVSTQRAIGEASGILMGRYDIDEHAAQAFLRRASTHSHVRIGQLAATLVTEANQPRKATGG